MLIVEDDPAVGQVIEDILRDAGVSPVRVQTDTAAYSALSIKPTFKAIIVDINLGKGTTGFDVARFARQKAPEITVVYVSGQSSKDMFRAFGVPESRFVQKPFGRDDLLDALGLHQPA